MTFKELGLGSASLKAIEDLGFSVPTEIQETAIPRLLSSARDLIAQSQTGTGKTAAFGFPIIEKIDTRNRKTQALVLAPTRELCRQITADFKSYSRYFPGISIAPIYGGSDMRRQMQELRSGVHIIVATPGRLLDMIRRNSADISGIGILVLDEADIMLDMGFKEELDAILSSAPEEKLSILLSATMPAAVVSLARNYMNDPEEITIGRKNTAAVNVSHKHVLVNRRDRYSALKRILDFNPDIYGIIFCRTRMESQEIAHKLLGDGYYAESLHGDLSQSQRDHVMGKFRDKNVKILVATDIAARGLDVEGLTHIIHYELPNQTEIYTHRSGRTGRAGKFGESLALVEHKERYRIKRIEKAISSRILEDFVPGGKQICERHLRDLMGKIKETEIDETLTRDFMPLIEEELGDLPKEELASRFITLYARRILEYYRHVPEKWAAPHQDKKDPQAKKRKKETPPKNSKKRISRQSNLIYLNINLGRKDNLLPPQLIGLINQSTRDRNIAIGNIDIGTNNTNFQVEENSAIQVADALNNFTYKNRKISVGFQEKKRKSRKSA